MKNKQVIYHNWGLIDYKEAWDKQEAIFADTVNTKIAIRNLQVAGDELPEELSTKTTSYFATPQCVHIGQERQGRKLIA